MPRIPKMNSRRLALLALLIARFGDRRPSMPPRIAAEAPSFAEGERVVKHPAREGHAVDS